MISPGSTETELVRNLPDRVKQIMAVQNPMKWLARLQDCAQAVLFLATGASKCVFGNKPRGARSYGSK